MFIVFAESIINLSRVEAVYKRSNGNKHQLVMSFNDGVVEETFDTQAERDDRFDELRKYIFEKVNK